MNRKIIGMTGEYLHKYINGSISSEKIIAALESQGYSTVFYNAISNNNDVAILSNMLGVNEYMRCSKGFTYTDSNNRIVFINEDLCEEEKIYVLLHEQGHILFRHFREGSVIGNDVIQEYEANEFVHYVMNSTIEVNIKRYKKQIILTVVILAISVIIIVLSGNVIQQETYFGNYYITETGHKYHEAECIFVKNKTNVRRITKAEFDSGDYEPCEICLPD